MNTRTTIAVWTASSGLPTTLAWWEFNSGFDESSWCTATPFDLLKHFFKTNIRQVLACGSSDGAISVLCYGANNQWEAEKINNAHTIGCNTLPTLPKNIHVAKPNIFPSEIARKLKKLFFSGCNSVSWAPGLGAGIKRFWFCTDSEVEHILLRFVSGGCDSLVKIWREGEDGRWEQNWKQLKQF